MFKLNHTASSGSQIPFQLPHALAGLLFLTGNGLQKDEICTPSETRQHDWRSPPLLNEVGVNSYTSTDRAMAQGGCTVWAA